MIAITPKAIPDWLRQEVNDYFVPLPFVPKTIIDIGANIGAFTRRAQETWPDAQIICCEPMPFNVVHLRRNVLANAIIMSVAVREQSGVDEIFIGDNFVTGGFTQFGRQTQKKILVECIAAIELPSCELVKIDTEGCEVEILQSLPLVNTKAILLEYHSRVDASILQSMLIPRFNLIHTSTETQSEVGTMVFLRA